MKKNAIIKIVLLIASFVMCMGLLYGCDDNDDFRNKRKGDPEVGEFYTLKYAFDNGWLSIRDLRSIAFHKTGDAQKEGFVPTPKDPEELDPETELAIKTDYAKILKEHDEGSENIADTITISSYYGIYDGLIAIIIDCPLIAYLDVISEEVIGGIVFRYGSSNTIWLYKYM